MQSVITKLALRCSLLVRERPLMAKAGTCMSGENWPVFFNGNVITFDL